jgi:NAD(P)-dependent dehydrogenase (short-subunit alcohol dehydrogenase family)
MERILITGASRGIGRAIGDVLARGGRELLLQGRDADALAAGAAEAERRGARATVLRYDLSDPEAVAALCDAIGDGPLHGLVNNAGVALVKPVDEIGLEEWQRALTVNLTAPFLLVGRLLGLMPPGAAIVNVLSVAARQGFPGWTAYCTAKFGLRGFSAALREEVRSRGIRVIDVIPAATATGLWDEVPGEWPRERMLDPQQVAEAVRFAVERPADVLVDEISLGNLGGTL